VILKPDNPPTVGGRVVRRSTHRDRGRGVSFVHWLGRRRHHRLSGPPDHVSALSSPGTWPVSGRLSIPISRRALIGSAWFPAAFRLPAFASWSSCSRPGVELSLRSAYRLTARRTPTGFPCFTRTSNDRGGCPLYSGDGGAHPDRSRSTASARRIPATCPYAPPQHPIHTGLRITKHQRGFKYFTRPIFPSPVTPGWNRSPWA
jgi:hypothetical protein